MLTEIALAAVLACTTESAGNGYMSANLDTASAFMHVQGHRETYQGLTTREETPYYRRWHLALGCGFATLQQHKSTGELQLCSKKGCEKCVGR